MKGKVESGYFLYCTEVLGDLVVFQSWKMSESNSVTKSKLSKSKFTNNVIMGNLAFPG